jgi:HK97 gp10 family phage protein
MDLEIDIQPSIDLLRARWTGAADAVEGEMLTLMRQSTGILENTAKANTPVRTGTLRRSITSNPVTATHGVVGTSVPYAKYVHEGTGARVIVPVNKKALYWPGAAHPVRRVNHPGTKANPFMRRALEMRRGEVIALWRTLAQRVLARLG